MKYVIMVSHGDFAPGLHSAVKMMSGAREGVFSVNLSEEMDISDFNSNFSKSIESIKKKDEIILFSDILSGSPFTNSLNILSEKGLLENTMIFAGMNMPAVLTAVLMKDNMDLEMLREQIINEGEAAFCEFKVQTTSDDDDEL